MLYKVVYLPWRARVFFLKYANVDMAEKFVPFLGDAKTFFKNREEERFQFYFLQETAQKLPQKDLRLTVMGGIMWVDIVSIKAQEEFEKKIPLEIDRHHNKEFPEWYPVRASFVMSPSTEYWKTRRTSTMKFMSINELSKYHSSALRAIDHIIEKLKSSSKFEISSINRVIVMH